MINQLFASNNSKAENRNSKIGTDLRLIGSKKRLVKRGQASKTEAPVPLQSEQWDIDATAALRVPVLAGDHDSEDVDSFISASDETVSGSEELFPDSTYGLQCIDVDEFSRAENNSVDTGDVIGSFGFYTESPEYRARMKTLLKKHNVDIEFFNSETEACERAISQHSAWIVDLSNESECVNLDTVLDCCNEVPALFLFDHAITPNILGKLSDFIQNQ